MIISKKTDTYWLLAIITILVMAVSVITFAPGVVKAEGEPASETATFTLEGTKEQQSDGEYYPYLIISGYDKAKYSSATIHVKSVVITFWRTASSRRKRQHIARIRLLRMLLQRDMMQLRYVGYAVMKKR